MISEVALHNRFICVRLTYEISSRFRCNKIEPYFIRSAFREPILPVLVVEACFSKIRTKC